MKTLSNERAERLRASLAWQQFSRESDEVSNGWETQVNVNMSNHEICVLCVYLYVVLY